MILRPYQLKTKAELYQKIREGKKVGKRKFIVCLPTGAGKTTIFCDIVKDAVLKERRILIVVDATKLIDQTSSVLKANGIKHGFIKAGRPEDRARYVQLCSIQTLNNREYPPADIIIIDECHVSYSQSYRKLYQNYPDALIIGFTATPERANPYESLQELYDDMIVPITISELIELGCLVPFQCYVLPEPNLTGIKIIKGDYETSALERVMTQDTLLQRAVDEWVRLGQQRPTIAFCVTIDHCEALSSVFNSNGISSDWISASTPDSERNKKFNALVSGKLKVLTSINTLTKGVDIPEVGCILGCRPTQSKALYIQAAGRGMRPAPDKDDCIYIDQAGNIHRFQISPTEYVPPPLTPPKSREEKGEMEVKECPNCGHHPIPNTATLCPKCGHKFGKDDGMKDHANLVTYESLFPGVSRMERQKFIQLAKVAYNKRYLPAYARMKFADCFGYPPKLTVMKHAIFSMDATDEDAEGYWEYLKALRKTKGLTLRQAQQSYSEEFGRDTTVLQNARFLYD